MFSSINVISTLTIWISNFLLFFFLKLYFLLNCGLEGLSLPVPGGTSHASNLSILLFWRHQWFLKRTERLDLLAHCRCIIDLNIWSIDYQCISLCVTIETHVFPGWSVLIVQYAFATGGIRPRVRVISDRCPIITHALLLTNFRHIDHILLLLHTENFPCAHAAVVDGALIKLEDRLVQLINMILVLNALVKIMIYVYNTAALRWVFSCGQARWSIFHIRIGVRFIEHNTCRFMIPNTASTRPRLLMFSVAMLCHVHACLWSLLLENSFIIYSEKDWNFLTLNLVVFFFLVVKLSSWCVMLIARLGSFSVHASVTLVS